MDVSRVQKEVPQMLLVNFPTLCIHDFATKISLKKDYDLCYTNYIFTTSIKPRFRYSHQGDVCKKSFGIFDTVISNIFMQ